MNHSNQHPEQRGSDSPQQQVSSSPNTVGDKLGDRLGDKLGVNRQQIIEAMRQHPKVSSSELAAQIGISKTAIENNIKWLKEQGIIMRHGSAKGGHWEVLAND